MRIWEPCIVKSLSFGELFAATRIDAIDSDAARPEVGERCEFGPVVMVEMHSELTIARVITCERRTLNSGC
jgi:hypothetical protein